MKEVIQVPIYFNSRPCVRGDKKKILLDNLGKYFNSRPCVRGDSHFAH